MTRSGAGIEDTPGSIGRQRGDLLQARPDRRGNEVEMTCFEECRSMPQLIETIAAFRPAPRRGRSDRSDSAADDGPDGVRAAPPCRSTIIKRIKFFIDRMAPRVDGSGENMPAFVKVRDQIRSEL